MSVAYIPRQLQRSEAVESLTYRRRHVLVDRAFARKGILVKDLRNGHLGVTVILALLAAVLVQRSLIDPPAPHVAAEKASFRDVWREMDGTVKHLLLADIFARVAGGLPQVFVVLYILNVLQWSSFQFGILISI